MGATAGTHGGIVALVGRPNAGKSTLLNALLGEKVSIVSDKAQTTRIRVRGISTDGRHQVVYVDTPGMHRPRTLLGTRLNDTALEAADGVDLILQVIDATAPVGSGDRWIADRLPEGVPVFVVVNKIDEASPQQVLEQLSATTEWAAEEYFPVSALQGDGVAALAAEIRERMPPGPFLFPPDVTTDTPPEVWVAELVREQLLAVAREELPHSIAAQVTEWEWPRIRCEILVERESQKGIVIGRQGAVLKAVGIAVRKQLPEGAYLELFVRVDPAWQRRARSLDRLGY